MNDASGVPVRGVGAVVVGASRGIGRSLAAELAARGYQVAALSRTAPAPEEAGDGAGVGVAPQAGQVSTWSCDVTRRAEVAETLERATAQLPPVALVVHCAAEGGPVGPLWEADVEHLHDTLEVNVASAFVVTRLALAALVAAGTGRLLLLSSGAATRPTRYRASYGASKAAVDHLVRTVGEELGVDAPDVSITGLYPGVVDTQMQARLRREAGAAGSEDVRREMGVLIGKGPVLSPSVVANRIADLAERDPRSLNGRILALRQGEWLET